VAMLGLEPGELVAQRLVVGLPVLRTRVLRPRLHRAPGRSRYSASPVKKRVGHSSVLLTPGYIGVFSGGRFRSIR
jgi:hypothetical protein